MSGYSTNPVNYPVYRKLEGFERYYEITDDRHFREAFITQQQVSYHLIEAKQFPEMLRIQDMISLEWKYVPMSEEEIARFFPKAQ